MLRGSMSLKVLVASCRTGISFSDVPTVGVVSDSVAGAFGALSGCGSMTIVSGAAVIESATVSSGSIIIGGRL